MIRSLPFVFWATCSAQVLDCEPSECPTTLLQGRLDLVADRRSKQSRELLCTSSDCTPAVFIVSSGRTGSTSILHMLNLIPGYDIKGGNMMLWPDVYDMNKVREEDFKIYQHSGLYAWHHANGRNETELMCSMKMMLLGELNPSEHARVIGYKAIKWRFEEDLKDLELLMEAFPCAKVILSKRRSIDDQLLSQGEVFGSMDYYATEHANKAMDKFAKHHSDRSFSLDLEDFDVEHFNTLLGFLGEDDKCRYVDVVHDNAGRVRSPAKPLEWSAIRCNIGADRKSVV